MLSFDLRGNREREAENQGRRSRIIDEAAAYRDFVAGPRQTGRDVVQNSEEAHAMCVRRAGQAREYVHMSDQLEIELVRVRAAVTRACRLTEQVRGVHGSIEPTPRLRRGECARRRAEGRRRGIGVDRATELV